MRKVKEFFTTIFIGGLTVILPVFIIFKLLVWLFEWITGVLQPITGLIVSTAHINEWLSEILAIVGLVFGCFLVGLFVKTTLGKLIHEMAERWFLEHLPGYKMLKEVFKQLEPSEKKSLTKPVLINLDGHESSLMGFITDEYDDNRFAVFIPTSPSPLNGFVVQTSADRIRFLDTSAENVMKAVIACGVGSSNIVAGKN